MGHEKSCGRDLEHQHKGECGGGGEVKREMAGARGLTEEEANKGIMTRREVGKETAGDGWGYWSDTSDHRDNRGPVRLAGPCSPRRTLPERILA